MPKPAATIDIDALDRADSEESLRAYAELAWPLVDPKPFVGNWHHDAICEHLEAVTHGEIQNLAINIPPRCTKSLMVSVIWPTWVWGPQRMPESRWLTGSYAMQLSSRDCTKSRRLMESGWFRRLWGDQVEWATDDNLKTRYLNKAGGHRIATATNATVTGEGGDYLLVDDPHNVRQLSETAILNTHDWWDQSMSTRGDDANTARVLVGQRVHHKDLFGHIEANEDPNEWTWLVLPMRYDPKHFHVWFDDPRAEPDDLLWEERFPEEEVRKLETRLGSHGSAGQLQQRPSPKGGGTFKDHWWIRKPRAIFPKLEDCDMVIASWDLSFKGKETSDDCAGFIMGSRGNRVYVYERFKGKIPYTQQKREVKAWADERPLDATVVEDAANAAALVDDLEDDIAGLIAVPARGDKLSRAEACSPRVEAGDVVLPEGEDWVDNPRDGFIAEHSKFTGRDGEDDNQVDAFTQGMRFLRNANVGVS